MSDPLAHLRTSVLFSTQAVCPQCNQNQFETYGLVEKIKGEKEERLYFVCMNCGFLVRGNAKVETLKLKEVKQCE